MSVINPGSRGQDDLGTVLNAVRLATDLYKFKVGQNQQEILNARAEAKQKAEAEEQARKAAGIRTPGEEMDLFSSGKIIPARPGEAGAVQLGVRQEDKRPILGRPASAYEAEVSAGTARERLAEDKKQRELETIATTQKEVRTDKRVNEALDSIDAANRVETLVDQESPILDSVALRQVFRLSGDVGVIRAEDLRDLGASPELKERFMQWVKQASEGQRIRPEAREDIRDMARIMRMHSEKQIKKRVNSISKTLATQVSSLNEDEARDMLIKQVQENFAPQKGAAPAAGGMTAEQIAAQELLKEMQEKAAQNQTPGMGGR